RLARNDYFWDKPAILKQVVFNLGRMGTGSLAQLLRNECDVMSSPISSQLQLIEQEPSLSLNMEQAMNVSFIALNTQHYALGNIKVRQALYYALHRQKIIDSVYYGSATLATGLLPPNSWASQHKLPTPEYDLAKAKRLLEESGIELPLHLTLQIQADPKAHNPSPKKTAELIQANFAKLGIQVDVLQDRERMRRNITADNQADMVLSGWTAATQDPDTLYRPLLSCQAYQAGLNMSNWCNPKFDRLLNLANQSLTRDEQQSYYQQVSQVLRQSVPMIPIAHSLQYRVYHSSLTGFQFNPFNSGRFNQVKRVY
ncbi:MAG: ABC transporter substrate-binding protein, partial [Vibrio sp.]